MPSFTSIHIEYNPGQVQPRRLQDYRGLTQTCRVARKEFTPLWLVTREWYIPVNFIAEYIKFLLHAKGRLEHQTPPFVVIEPNGPLSFSEDLDILPLMTSHHNHDRYRISKLPWTRARPISGVADIIAKILGCHEVLESVGAGHIVSIRMTQDRRICAAVRNGS
jgi:hypothetical protein